MGLASRASALAVVIVLAAVAVGCGDGTPKFCDSLARQADMGRLSSALDAGDLPKARREAARFSKLAEEAPDEVRPDLKALASGVSDVVRILEADKAGGDPAALERQREELNNRLSELGRRSTSVQTWASRECGIDL